MENLNKESKPYKSGEYEEMFNASEIASMAAENIVAKLHNKGNASLNWNTVTSCLPPASPNNRYSNYDKLSQSMEET